MRTYKDTDISDDDLLKLVAEASASNSRWEIFSRYCIFRAQGLRSAAFEELSEFLRISVDWEIEEKISFVTFIYTFEDEYHGSGKLLPVPLYEQIVKPTLELWCNIETQDSRPFRWVGTLEYLFKAIEIDPKDEKARILIIEKLMYEIYFSIHHLPDGYIGYPEHDMTRIGIVTENIEKLSDELLKDKFTKSLNEDLEIISNYIEWQKAENDDFKNWGIENNKITSYRKQG